MHAIEYKNHEKYWLAWYAKEMENHYLMLNDNVFKPILKAMKENDHSKGHDFKIDVLRFYYFDLALNHIKKENKNVFLYLSTLPRVAEGELLERKEYIRFYSELDFPDPMYETILETIQKISELIDIEYYDVKAKCCPTIWNCLKKAWKI
jgi:hypothetical protein